MEYGKQSKRSKALKGAITRALAVQPGVLVLDELFGALDAITKEALQEELLTIWAERKPTVLMITHPIDEALFLAERVVMMTKGPAATIGEIMEVPFARPRSYGVIEAHECYGQLHNHALVESQLTHRLLQKSCIL